jgi:hypothetical protein
VRDDVTELEVSAAIDLVAKHPAQVTERTITAMEVK